MFLITVLTGKMAGQFLVVRHFPFRVGRAAESDARLEDEGVWPRHFELIQEGNTCAIQSMETALVTVNGGTVTKAALRNGDEIDIGAVKLRFGLAPVELRGLVAREGSVWVFLVLVFLIQFWMIYRLLEPG
jgi:pSer/pThr/pTyr-binding forkhead associated (FHA) protein